MKKIYLARHGETQWNVEMRMQGWEDSPLTDQGMANARELGAWLKQIEWDAIYASPTYRAFHTAELAVEGRGYIIQPKEEFREMNMGRWEGKRKEDLTGEDLETYRNFWQDPCRHLPPEGESLAEVQKRALAALQCVLEETKDYSGNILIVTHTVVIKVILAHYHGVSLDRIWEMARIPDTSLTVLEIDGEAVRVLAEGWTPHQPDGRE